MRTGSGAIANHRILSQYNLKIEGKKISDEEMDTMKKYITYKHKSDIRRMRQCNIDNLVFDLQNIDVKKLEGNK